ncbi:MULTISPECIES: SpoIIE family protein phosphatase [unclassified Carboxydocella]|uniref:SpoIIE family protein phosphatase n=1 Tax=unclassified Carboxydocella TaxID=2685367 RepID=UPI0009AE61B4|nr:MULTISPECIES: SpoIIE family protein phosphatase [unclassified Carboxydocella]GAW27468.1 stage II sporulation protein E [Carboxydocella sp. ULO1]GAW30367.1 stage II sporulation protein E [Carboxydocella sp. JDF658]
MLESQFEIYPYRQTEDGQAAIARKERWRWPDLSGLLKVKRVRPDFKDLIWLGIAAILANSMILEDVSPFYPALLGGIAWFNARRQWATSLGVALTLAIKGDYWQLAVASMLALGFATIIGRIPEQTRRRWFLPILVGSLDLTLRAGMALLRQAPLYAFVASTVEAVLAAVLAYFMLVWLPPLLEKREKAVEAVGGLGILGTGILIGLNGIEINGLSLVGILSRLLILLAATIGGIGGGTVIGTIIGLIPALTARGYSPVIVGVYAFGGLLAGIFERFGRWGPALGLMLSNIFLSLYTPDPRGLLIIMGETLIAVLLFLLLPARLLEEWQRRAGRVRRQQERQLKEEAEKLKAMTAQRILEFASVFQGLSNTFEQLINSTGREGEEDALPPLVKEACGRCSRLVTCWQREERATRQGIRLLLNLAEAQGGVDSTQVSRALKYCFRMREMAAAINCLASAHRLHKFWEHKIQESQELVKEQLRGVSNLMESFAYELAVTGETAEVLDWPYQVEYGIAKVAKDGCIISGDSTAVQNLNNGKFLLALSDGMGTGTRAAVQSQAALSLLTQLLEMGYDPEIAVKTVNSAMIMRSKDEEEFATLDLALIDLQDGSAHFVKIGAVFSLIKREHRIGLVKSGSLPIGILQQMEPDQINVQLEPGDIVVMFSDGVIHGTGACPEEWLAQVLHQCRTEDPENLAHYILNSARIQANNRIADDMTVIVFRLIKK